MKLPRWLSWIAGPAPESKTHWFFDQARFERESRLRTIRIRQLILGDEIRTAIKQKQARAHLYAEQTALMTERLKLEREQ